MQIRLLTLLLLLYLFSSRVSAQSAEEDAFFIRKIYDTALTQGQAYDFLTALCQGIGPRLAGSPGAAASVRYVKQILDTLDMDKVRLQECTVPHWYRGEPEIVRVVNSRKMGSMDLPALALGNSIGTGPDGITAPVVEVQGLEELEELGTQALSGKIVFFNRPLDVTQLNTFAAYGGAVDQRVYGAARASRFGAVAVIVRSMTTGIDDVPHTGVTVYDDSSAPIPALAISTRASELLSSILAEEEASVYIRNTSRNLTPKPSYNVIGEIKGSTHPDEIILVGGHLDAWDVGEGAHDDGSGCVHAIEVINLLRKLGYTPKRTIRCVLFMNEENGQAGAIAYRDASREAGEYHLAAIESDRGGFTPRGFTCDGDASIFEQKFRQVYAWQPLLAPYGLGLKKGGSGADISRLKYQKGLLFGFEPDSQRYFDFHHTAADVLEVVNPRELELGAAAMTSLVYLLDKYGLE